MRIIGGDWRGRALVAPAGVVTRPTSDRVRQAVFDRLVHAPWAAGVLTGARVLDAYAGTGAMGLEALSRGAGWAGFMERDRGALAALRANVAGCGAGGVSRIYGGDVLAAPRGEGCGVVFLDPPYGTGAGGAVAALRGAGWIVGGTLLVVEGARGETVDFGEVVASFAAGVASVSFVLA